MSEPSGVKAKLFDAVFYLVACCAIIVTGMTVWNHFTTPAAAALPAGVRQLNSEPTKVEDWDRLVKTGHRFGATNPTTTMVIFGDFECPACRAFATTTLATLRRKYPDDLAIVFHHWPLPYHRFAYPAARASECAAAQGRFEAFHDLMYAKQDSLGLKPFTAFAQDAGVPDAQAFARCASATDSLAIVKTDTEDALTVRGAGTPTVLINGLVYPHIPRLAEAQQIIEAAKSGGAPNSPAPRPNTSSSQE